MTSTCPDQLPGDEGPFDPGMMLVGHADEPAAGQRGPPGRRGHEKREVPKDGRVPDVVFVTVVKANSTSSSVIAVLAFDAQLEGPAQFGQG